VEEHFDPYRKWLGIPPEEQPPHHYRLLGIALFEDDPDVISNAADRQMAHVRTFQTGKRAALSQALLNELSAANVCLLNPQTKQQYDAQLLAYQSQLTRAVAAPAQLNPAQVVPLHPQTGLPMAIPVGQDTDTYTANEAQETIDDAVPTIRTNRKTKIAFPVDDAPQSRSAPPAAARPNAPRPVVARPIASDATIAVAEAPIAVTMRGARAARRSTASSVISIVVAVGLLVVLIFVAAFFLGGDNSSADGNPSTAKESPSKDKPKTVTPKPPAPNPTPVVNASTNDKPLDIEKPKPPEKDTKKPTDKKPTDLPKDKPADQPQEKPKDKPAEVKPAEVKPTDKPVPTEAETPHADSPLPPPAVIQRPPAPVVAAIDKAYRLVRKEFEPQLRQASLPEERVEIAQQIVERAAEATDPATQYALYQLARNLGVQMASAEQACDAIDLLAAKFDVDAFDMKRQTLDEISQFVTHSLEDYEHLLRFMQRLAREALAAEKSDAAVGFTRLAKATALKVRSPKAIKELPQLEDLLAQVDALFADVAEYDREVKAFDRNTKQLQKEPNDLPAHLGLGRYWLFVRGDWAKALPHLAKCADPAWKEPATLDLAGPKTPAEQVAVADAWAALAPRKGGLAKPRLLDRAKTWYARALAAAPDAEKPAIQAKLTGVESQLKALAAAQAAEAGSASSAKSSAGDDDEENAEKSDGEKPNDTEPAFPE
jgi:hypothetical protein